LQCFSLVFYDKKIKIILKFLYGSPPRTDISQLIIRSRMWLWREVLAQKNARKIVIFLNNKNEKNLIKMLQILSNYGNINNIENKQQANTMKTIRITLKDAKRLNLSWKLIGLWEIRDESESEKVLIRRIEEPMVEYISRNLNQYELSKGTIKKLER